MTNKNIQEDTDIFFNFYALDEPLRLIGKGFEGKIKLDVPQMEYIFSEPSLKDNFEIPEIDYI